MQAIDLPLEALDVHVPLCSLISFFLFIDQGTHPEPLPRFLDSLPPLGPLSFRQSPFSYLLYTTTLDVIGVRLVEL